MVTRVPTGARPREAAGKPVQLPAAQASGTLARLESEAQALISRSMRPLKLAQGARVFSSGDSASNYLMVKSGSVRVSITTEEGREITLYHVEPGQTCVLTTSCLLSGAEYGAEAVTEAETEAIILPKPAFEQLLAMSPKFRQFVFSSYGDRLHTLIGLVQEITARKLDRKLARFLVEKEQDGIVALTHEKMALELNTAREVVTLLNDFSGRGWLSLSRGRVQIADRAALENYSGSS
jgi:CRP/FNR family transcriptional regulator